MEGKDKETLHSNSNKGKVVHHHSSQDSGVMYDQETKPKGPKDTRGSKIKTGDIENLFNEIIAENLSNLEKEMTIRTQNKL